MVFARNRGCKDALREVDELIKEGYAHVVDADLESYFDRSRRALMGEVWSGLATAKCWS